MRLPLGFPLPSTRVCACKPALLELCSRAHRPGLAMLPMCCALYQHHRPSGPALSTCRTTQPRSWRQECPPRCSSATIWACSRPTPPLWARTCRALMSSAEQRWTHLRWPPLWRRWLRATLRCAPVSSRRQTAPGCSVSHPRSRCGWGAVGCAMRDLAGQGQLMPGGEPCCHHCTLLILIVESLP